MMIWQAAQHNAEVMRQKVTQGGRPFSLEAVADALNIDVHYRYDLPPGASGLIIKKANDDRARVYINASDVSQRQRFTLAHEIGHYVERMVEAKDKEFSFRDGRERGKYDLHEFYADQFAGALLMPEDEVRRITPELQDALAVAAHFDVSIPAAQARLKRLRKQAPE